MAFKRDDWNDLIDDVNDIIQNPPADTDCEPQSPIDHVGTSHIWTKTDIQQVQDAIKATCDSISFDDIPDLWKQAIIDDINEALEQAWCDCEPDHNCRDADGRAEHNSETSVYSNGPPTVQSNCFGSEGTEIFARDFINGLQIAASGYVGRVWQLFRRNHYNDGHTSISSSLASGTVNCEGKITYTGNATFFTTSGIGVNCSDCNDIACEAALDQAQQDLSGPNIFYSEWFVRLLATGAFCFNSHGTCTNPPPHGGGGGE